MPPAGRPQRPARPPRVVALRTAGTCARAAATVAASACRARHGRNLQVVCGDRRDCASAMRSTTHGASLPVLPRRTRCIAATRAAAANSWPPMSTCWWSSSRRCRSRDLFVVDRYLAAAAMRRHRGAAAAEQVPTCGIRAGLDAELAAWRAPATPLLQLLGAHRRRASDALRARPARQHRDAGRPVRRRQVLAAARAGAGKRAPSRRTDAQTRGGRHTTTARTVRAAGRRRAARFARGARLRAGARACSSRARSDSSRSARWAPQCRFADCRHLREPGCAVRAAVDSGTMAPRRYESYRRLRRLHDDQLPGSVGRQRRWQRRTAQLG